MARRELNVFSLSFLDLLSGALAAVIILFVIVPKQDARAEEAQSALEDLNLQAEDLEKMVEQLENSVDASVYEALNNQFQQLSEALESAQVEVNRLTGERDAAQRSASQLRTQNQELETQVERLASDNTSVRAENRQLREQQSDEGEQTFGVAAAMAVIFKWNASADVDIHFKNTDTGVVCYHARPVTPFARLLKDRTDATGDGSYEMVYQEELVPGNYEVYLKLYGKSSSQSLPVISNGYIIVNPYTSRKQRVNIGPVRLAEVGKFLRVHTFSLDATSGITSQ